jgi:hypothetical protein
MALNGFRQRFRSGFRAASHTKIIEGLRSAAAH